MGHRLRVSRAGSQRGPHPTPEGYQLPLHAIARGAEWRQVPVWPPQKSLLAPVGIAPLPTRLINTLPGAGVGAGARGGGQREAAEAMGRVPVCAICFLTARFVSGKLGQWYLPSQVHEGSPPGVPTGPPTNSWHSMTATVAPGPPGLPGVLPHIPVLHRKPWL